RHFEPERPGEAEIAEAGDLLLGALEVGAGAVGRAVVDEDQLVVAEMAAHDGVDLAYDRWQDVEVIVQRDDDGNEDVASHPFLPLSTASARTSRCVRPGQRLVEVEDVVDLAAQERDQVRRRGVALEQNGSAVVDAALRQDRLYLPERPHVAALPQ